MNAPELRLPPHSTEAEQSVVGALLLDSGTWDRIADIVSEGDFYRDDHRRIFAHIRKLAETGKPADVVTVADSIRRTNEADLTGGQAYLIELANTVPSTAAIRRYAEIIADRSALRRLQSVANEILELATGPGNECAAARIDDAERKISAVALATARAANHEPVAIGTVLGPVVDRIQQLYDREDRSDVTGLPTGFADLDRKLSGLHPGDLVIVAGRPSMGKTALALNMAESVATTGKPALVFSLEMGAQQLGVRALASIGRIDMGRLRNGRLQDDDWDKMTVALGKLHEAPLVIDESSSLSASQMALRAKRVMRQRGLSLVVIDYLQLMRGDGNTRNEELADVTRRLKMMAKDLGVPVIALSQLSREVEKRTDKRPQLSDLRESGAIEQDADIILMIYRDEYYNVDSQERGTAEVIVAKQRNGPTGEVRLAFQAEFSRFSDLAPDDLARFDHARATAKAQKTRRRGFDV